ncbi:hypothetical protein HK414_11515 [Ramlibacter terrae]|uniref:Uncharacterized protein n=1 Tax=Ramlibacter terrae TaxID=2732511 RepID=A0ABX6P2F6_9BURK|nr:hypothetical protein HK414_11515 [Ramlibacter terrae]
MRATVLGAPGDRRVRVVADTPIDEPIVTVAVRAGCRNSVTRTYTLLPAMPSGPTLAAAAARSSGAAGISSVASPVRLAAATSPTALRPPRASRPVAAEGPTRARAARMERARESGGGARLRLDVWEPEPAQSPATLLRVSAQLSQPTHDAAARATAALLWQALNADPSELLRTSLTLQRLEGELAGLRTTADQTRAEMAALRQVLEAPPEGFRLSSQFTQALTLLVLAGAAVAAFLWWRTARQQHVGGWNGQPLDSTLDSVSPRQDPPPPVAAVVERTAEVPSQPAPVSRSGPQPRPDRRGRRRRAGRAAGARRTAAAGVRASRRGAQAGQRARARAAAARGNARRHLPGGRVPHLAGAVGRCVRRAQDVHRGQQRPGADRLLRADAPVRPRR